MRIFLGLLLLSLLMAAARLHAEPKGVGPQSPSDEMVLIPAGEFWMGCNPAKAEQCEANEKPGHAVVVPAFRIDKREVSVAAYARCVQAGKCKKPASGSFCNGLRKDRRDHPANCVSWHKARAYCEFAGKRLPSEAEWEKAARGSDRRLYPWGDAPPDCDKVIFDNGTAGCGRKSTWPVGSKAAGAGPYGVLNMTGNVGEWVQDPYHRNYHKAPVDGGSWEKPRRTNRVSRGGSFGHPGIRLRIARRHEVHPSIEVGYIGFRCAKDVVP